MLKTFTEEGLICIKFSRIQEKKSIEYLTEAHIWQRILIPIAIEFHVIFPKRRVRPDNIVVPNCVFLHLWWGFQMAGEVG